MEVWCVCLGVGEEGGGRAGRQEGRACGGGSSPLLSACVGECCCAGWRGVAVTPVCPGKQCPRRVFYGSCWTLISFVPRLSRAAAALSPSLHLISLLPPPAFALPSPQKRAPPPSLEGKKKPRTTRSCGLTGVRNRLPHYPPRGQVCNKSIWKEINIESTVAARVRNNKRKKHGQNKCALSISLMNHFAEYEVFFF